jgi:hypothetical protein
MARVTAEEVQAIMDTDLTEAKITGYIDSVTIIVDGLFNSVSISDPLLKEIERWLTAHAIAISSERQAREEGAGGAYIKYAGMTGIGLKATSYGQMAISIDTTGTLLGSMGKAASIYVIPE